MSITGIYTSIPMLLEVPERDRDLPWLKAALQWAVELELATLPPYLCARWSISADAGGAVTALRRIAKDEMLHMGAVANMLRAIGGAPVMRGDVVPVYPTELPGGVHPGVRVTLGAFTKAQLALFMKVEEPAEPIPSDPVDGETFDTIGLFYKAISGAFLHLKPSIDYERQVGSGGSPRFKDLDEIVKGIERISLEGEGLSKTPYYNGQLTHHYVFGEFFHGRRIKETSPGRWSYTGDVVPAPEVLSLKGAAPVGDVDNKQLNEVYTEMLVALHRTWNDEPDEWTNARSAMNSLANPARKVMSRGYWPTFTYLKA